LGFDGPKWVCGLLELAPPCVVYSFGSNNNFAFEDHVIKMNHHCSVFVFDPTSEPPQSSSPLSRTALLEFNRTGLCPPGKTSFTFGAKTLPCSNLAQLMADRGHSHVDVLKIDVDSAEWDVVLKSNWDHIRVGQLLIEMHAYAPLPVGRIVSDFMKPLERHAGLLPWFVEPVCQGCPGQLEFGFINPQWQPANSIALRWRSKFAIALALPSAALSNHTHLTSWMRALRHYGCQDDVMLVALDISLLPAVVGQLVMLASQLGVRAVAPLSELDVASFSPAGRAFLGEVDDALQEYDHVQFFSHARWAATDGTNHTRPENAPRDVADRLLESCDKDAAVCGDAADACLVRTKRLARRKDHMQWTWPCVSVTGDRT
jgi:hypothetical protein